MPETPETASDIQEIRFRLEAIEATQTLLVRDRAEQLKAQYLAFFEHKSFLAPVYLAIDGIRTQVEILRHLQAQQLKLSQPTLSRRMNDLSEAGLIELVRTDGAGDVYEKNRTVERLLLLSKHIA